MFTKLKKFFTKKTEESEYLPPLVEVVSFEDGLLKIRRSDEIGPGVRQVRINTATSCIEAEIEILSLDPSEDCYRARLRQQVQILSQLRLERRNALRVPKVLRVFSRSFPDFQATTEDISIRGARVKTRQLLERTHDIVIRIELDDPNSEPLELYADIAWSAERVDGSFHSGLRFLGMDDNTQRRLLHYLNERLEMESRLVSDENWRSPNAKPLQFRTRIS